MELRVGIMGGTLDPIHNGHVQMALEVKRLLDLDRVMLLPAGDPPHKLRPISKHDRLQMVRLAAEANAGLFPCSVEILRDGTTYTVDTLEELTRVNPTTQWYYIIGQDTLEVLDSWRSFERVSKMCTFAVIGRADAPASRTRADELRRRYGARFELLPINGPDISSTQIRESIARGENVHTLLPEPVARYIEKKGLYLCDRSFDDVRKKLASDLKPSRWKHTLGVAETARRLAERYGIDPIRAELAGLLHDCAKYLPVDTLRELVSQAVPDADSHEMETVSVLHAPAGSVVAARDYGVRDPAILSAIRKHTLGAEEMSPLDALIYTADFIEPNREPFPGLEQARALAESDLYAAMCRCAELTNEYVIQRGNRPHQRSFAMLRHYGKCKV